jgi:two-component system sensor histidine kinase KdpD
MASRVSNAARLATALAAVAGVTLAYVRWLHVSNATIVALTFLLIVLMAAATSPLWIAVATSAGAVLCFNYFFLPPVGTWTIADPQNWVALAAFLAVSLVASRLSIVARARADDALARRAELTRLFDLSRDVLSVTDSQMAMSGLARSVARRFDLDYVGIALPRSADWEVFRAGPLDIRLEQSQLADAFAAAERTVEFDAYARTYSGHRSLTIDDRTVRLVPLRTGTQPVGLLAVSGRSIEPGTLDALAGIMAMAIERATFLDERKAADLTRQSEELKAALLASLSHDLRTPLTAIRVAASNLQAEWLTPEARREQAELVLGEVEQLTRTLQDILEMARIDAGNVATEFRWVHPSEIVGAARAQVEHALRGRPVNVLVDPDSPVRLDPRLTATAIAHVLENAARYTPADSLIELTAGVTSDDGFRVAVRDHGPGIARQDLPHLFERFFRGADVKRRITGTGMGLSIARGLLAAEGGRIWAENCPDGGAQFTIAVPAAVKTSNTTASPAL